MRVLTKTLVQCISRQTYWCEADAKYIIVSVCRNYTRCINEIKIRSHPGEVICLNTMGGASDWEICCELRG